MIIVNNTAPNFAECKDVCVSTWKGKQDLYELDAEYFNGHCTNKINAIKSAHEKYPNENLLYLDSDVIMVEELSDELFTHDILTTRMVVRPERPYYKEVNAGVFLMKSNERTAKFIDEWFKLDKIYQQNPDIPYPEQRAFNDLAYKGYDGLREWTVGNLSENIYNFERDDTQEWMDGIEKYNPKLIHMKTKRWQNPFCLDYLRKNGIIK